MFLKYSVNPVVNYYKHINYASFAGKLTVLYVLIQS